MNATANHTYYISTDSGSFDEPAEFDSLADALDSFDAPGWVRDAAAFVRWLEKCGGYGFIEIDGERVAEVKS